MKIFPLLIATLSVAACGSEPDYCSGTTDTRHVGTWKITYTEIEGDCGPLDDQTVEYPAPTSVPKRDTPEYEVYKATYFGRVRQKAWLQPDCSYEGSFHYETTPPEDVVKNNAPWPAPSSQVSEVLSVNDGEISGTLTLAIEDDYRGEGACESRYTVELVRVE